MHHGYRFDGHFPEEKENVFGESIGVGFFWSGNLEVNLPALVALLAFNNWNDGRQVYALASSNLAGQSFLVTEPWRTTFGEPESGHRNRYFLGSMLKTVPSAP